MYQNILLAVDGSEHSLRATDEAVKIASLNSNSQVDIVLVAESSKEKMEVLHVKDKEQLESTQRKKITPALEKLRKQAHEVHILHGNPGLSIVEFANQGNFDLLIIGSRGLNVFQEMVLGSVSHKVVKRAKCPVMVVK